MCYGCNFCNRCGRVDRMREENAQVRCPCCGTKLLPSEGRCPSCGAYFPAMRALPGESVREARRSEAHRRPANK